MELLVCSKLKVDLVCVKYALKVLPFFIWDYKLYEIALLLLEGRGTIEIVLIVNVNSSTFKGGRESLRRKEWHCSVNFQSFK